MAIFLIQGASGTGKSTIANALRNNQVAHKKGALIVDEASDAEAKPLLEKLLVGAELPQPAPAGWQSKLPWKDSPTVILVGAKAALLDVFEEMLPGFRQKFGPVHLVQTSIMAGSPVLVADEAADEDDAE